jgi:hypothetical protein
MEYMTTVLGAPAAEEMAEALGHASLVGSSSSPPQSPSLTPDMPAEGGDQDIEQAPLSLIQEENLDADYNEDAPLRFQSINKILDPTSS